MDLQVDAAALCLGQTVCQHLHAILTHPVAKAGVLVAVGSPAGNIGVGDLVTGSGFKYGAQGIGILFHIGTGIVGPVGRKRVGGVIAGAVNGGMSTQVHQHDVLLILGGAGKLDYLQLAVSRVQMVLVAGLGGAVAVAVGGAVVHQVMAHKHQILSLGAAVVHGGRGQILNGHDTGLGSSLPVLFPIGIHTVPGGADGHTVVGVGGIEEDILRSHTGGSGNILLGGIHIDIHGDKVQGIKQNGLIALPDGDAGGGQLVQVTVGQAGRGIAAGDLYTVIIGQDGDPGKACLQALVLFCALTAGLTAAGAQAKNQQKCQTQAKKSFHIKAPFRVFS